MDRMSTGDEQTNGVVGFGTTRQPRIFASGNDESLTAEGSSIQRRSRVVLVKVRENLQLEAESKAKKAAAAVARAKKPPSTSTADTSSVIERSDLVVHSVSLGDEDVGSDIGDYSPSKATKFEWNRSNRLDALLSCDFESHDSINKWFPKYKSKGIIDIPLFMLRAAHDNKGKAKMVREFRCLTTVQQRFRVAEARTLYHTQLEQAKSCNNRRARLVSDASDEVGEETQQQQPHRKKQRNLADDRGLVASFEENEDAWSRVLVAAEEKQARAEARELERAKRATERQLQQQQQQTTINGLLDGGSEAAESSAAAAAIKTLKRRKSSDPPTRMVHLNDSVVRKLIHNVEQAATRVAKATQPEEELDVGSAIVSTVVMTVVNICRPSRNGGGGSSLQMLERPKIQIINPGGDRRVLDLLMPAIQRVRDIDNKTINHPVSHDPVLIDEHITYCTNGEQVNNDHEMSNRKRQKAPVNDTQQSLGARFKPREETFDD